MDRFAKLGFVTNPLDRRAELRDQPDAIAKLSADSDARFLVFAGDVSV